MSVRIIIFTVMLFTFQLSWAADVANTENYIFDPDHQACYPQAIAPAIIFPEDGSPTQAFSELLTQTAKHQFNLMGNVLLQTPQAVIKADNIIINNQTKTANVEGNIHLYTKDFTALGTRAKLDQTTSSVIIDSPIFQLTKNFSHGTGKTFRTNRENQLSILKDATFTTCKLQDIEKVAQLRKQTGKHDLLPDDVDWMIKIEKLELDDAMEMVYGKHAVLYFKSIPVLYTPYFQFSTAKRKTGLLVPSIGGNKSITQKNVESYVSLPFYFNISPEMDDTFTLTTMQDRGLLLGNEFRYLQTLHNATFTSHYIRDKVSGSGTDPNNLNLKPINERWDLQLRAEQNWNNNISSQINWRKVSDKYFYADLPINSSLQTKSYLSRDASIHYQKDNLNAHILLLDYLHLQDNSTFNYTKKPEVGIEFSHYFKQNPLQNISFNLYAEATEFEISESVHNKPEALRAVFSPSLQYNINKPYGHFKTELVANQIHYKMQDNGFNNTGADSHSISVPQFAISGGLIFTRDFSFADNDLIQTLEPQIQYLYAPYQKQSNITLFDSSETSLDFSNLFAYNRFSGYDRIADSNQVSVALTTKVLSPKGKTLVEAGVGQIFFLTDQKVQLTGNTISNETASDYYAKIGFSTNHFSLNTTAQFSQDNYELRHANSRLKVDMSPDFTFLLADTVKNNNQVGEREEVSAGFNWRMNNQWALGSYINYDFTDQRREELSAAIRYDNCCWASELSVKETKLENGLYNYSFQYQIELKGLSSAGTSFHKYLTEQLNF